MTTQASLPPPVDPYAAYVVQPRTSAAETDAAGGASPSDPGGVVPGRITTTGAPAGVVTSSPLAAAWERAETIRPGHLDRVPTTEHATATDERHGGALAAEAELEALAATYGEVRAVIASSGERAALQPGLGAPAGEAGPPARAFAEEVPLARVACIQEGLDALTATTRERVDSDIAALTKAAELIDAANRDNRGARTRSSVADADPQVAGALRQLSALAGATARIAGDGTIEVHVGDRLLVGLRGVQELVAHRGEAVTAPHTEAAQRTPAGLGDTGPTDVRDSGVAVTWKSGRRIEALGGALAGHLTALGGTLPRIGEVVTEIAAVARAEAAPAGTAAAHRGGAPAAANLIEELDTALGAAESAVRQRVDVASAMVAIRSGPPAAFFAGVVAATGAAMPADPGRITASATQNLITDLQVVQSATRELAGAAQRLAPAEPLTPLTAGSSQPEVLIGEVAGAESPAPVGHSDASPLTEPLRLGLDVVTAAHGDTAVSNAGLPPFTEVSRGAPVTLSVGVGPAVSTSGEQAEIIESARIALTPPVGVASIAESVNETAAEQGVGLDRVPDLPGVADQVSALVGSVDAVLTAVHNMEVSGMPMMSQAKTTAFEQTGPASEPSAAASDVAVGALAASFAAAISGVPVMPVSGVAVPGTLIPGGPGIPGVTAVADEAGRRRVVMDREVFLRTLSEDPAGTRSAVRAASTEVAAAARESLDERFGLFALRLGQELRSARDVSATPAAPERGAERREMENTRRAETLTALLERLQDQSGWLRRQLA